ncbi:MAG: N-acetylglucosamine-6-phosphate deacetylase [Verrucomicrobiales bacterium]|nr:N-acetylglucosamine-6-phosphate deacetylase [Verrucomicrobiales bacterium]
MMPPLLLNNCRLAFPDFIAPGAILLEEGKIGRIWLDETPALLTKVRELDCAGLLVAPGLVDIHNHGGLTFDFGGANAAGNNAALDFHASHGVTTMLATVMTETHERMAGALRLLAEQRRAGELCPNFLGIHVEGPYFHPDKRGAHKLECLRDPVRSEYELFWKLSDGLIRIFTHAPERTGSVEFCQFFHERGCVPTIGHTRATMAEIRRVAAYGARHFVHANNAIDWPQRRTRSEGWLGTEMMGMGTLLAHSSLTGEIISDGYHVPVEMIRVILAAKGSDAVAIVSDACPAAGCEPGEYLQGGLKIILKEGGLVLSGAGSMDGTTPLGGSATTQIQMIRNYIKWGFGLLTPLKMATTVPARIIGERNKGSLCVGSDAYLIVIDDGAELYATIIGGVVVHARDPQWRE